MKLILAILLFAQQTFGAYGIPNGSVTNAKLANSAVTSAKIADATIVEADLQEGLPESSARLSNLELRATTGVSDNILTIALKTRNAVDPSSTDVGVISFSQANGGAGQATHKVTITSAMSMTISSGSTMGWRASTSEQMYIYMIKNNVGTIEMCAATNLIATNTNNISITQEDGAGGADNRYTCYGPSAITGSARLIGMISSNGLATPGEWSSGSYRIYYPPMVDTASLTTAANNGAPIQEIVRHGTIACNSSSSVTGGNLIFSSTNVNGGGSCTLTLNSGLYSGTPDCWVTGRSGDGILSIAASDSVTAQMDCKTDAGAACTNYSASVLCIGYK